MRTRTGESSGLMKYMIDLRKKMNTVTSMVVFWLLPPVVT
jgi:hypothetical protein